MKTRRALFELGWNGVAGADRLTDAATGITYTDPASGEADSIDININDRDRKWIAEWMPSAGDTMTAKKSSYRTGNGRVTTAPYPVAFLF